MKNKKMLMLVFIAIIFIAVILLFVFSKKEDRDFKSYSEAINSNYFTEEDTDTDVSTQNDFEPPYGYDENGNVVVPNVTTTTYEYEIPDYVTEFFTTGDGYTDLKYEIKYIEDILGTELVVSEVHIERVPDDFYYYASYLFENFPMYITAIYTWDMPEAEFAIYNQGNTVESGGAYIYFPDGIPDNLADMYYSPSYPASMMYGVCLGHDGDTYYLRDMETNIDYTVTIGM